VAGGLGRVQATELHQLGGGLADVEQLSDLLPWHPAHPGRQAERPAAAEHDLGNAKAAVERGAGPHRQVEHPLSPERAVEEGREEQLAGPLLEGVEVEGGAGQDHARRLEVLHPGAGDEDAPSADPGHETEEDRGGLPGRRTDDQIVDPAHGVTVRGDQRKLENPGGVDLLGAAHRSSVRHDVIQFVVKTSGIERGPRTWPPHHVTGAVSSR
jgi:hypothetical protein